MHLHGVAALGTGAGSLLDCGDDDSGGRLLFLRFGRGSLQREGDEGDGGGCGQFVHCLPLLELMIQQGDGIRACCGLGSFHELRFQLHCADAVDLAVDIVIAFDQADVLHLGADLDHQRRAFDLEILDHGHAVSVLQRVAIGVADDALFIGARRRHLGPFVRALGADVHLAVFVSEFRTALRTLGQGAHGWVPVLIRVLRMIWIRLKVDSNDVVRLEFVGHGAVPGTRDHGAHGVAQLNEVLGADRVIETLAKGNLIELDTVKARV